ncbi:hypothetical protein TNIN_263091, partial [Trichonephila inaurata madagascariensis]
MNDSEASLLRQKSLSTVGNAEYPIKFSRNLSARSSKLFLTKREKRRREREKGRAITLDQLLSQEVCGKKENKTIKS